MKSTQCYGLYDNNNIIGICGILPMPHPVNKKLRRVTRLVVLPDYQGIGLGKKFLNEIAKMYVVEGYDFSIITSAKNLINALRNDNNWCMARYSKIKMNASATYEFNRNPRNCYTASFFYKR